MPTHKVPVAMDGQRLDRFLKTLFPHVPYVGLQRVLRLGYIRVNEKKCKPDSRLVAGDVVTYPLTLPAPVQGASGMAYAPTNADAKLLRDVTLLDDAALLVLNKPAGVAAQAGGGVVKSLDRMVAVLDPENPPKLTHRLDRETTGVIVLAKTRAAAADVTAQFAAHDVNKVYVLLVAGRLAQARGDIEAPLKKVTGPQGPKVVVAKDGDHAHTSYVVQREVSRDGEIFTLLHATPHTGRMNQLRAHFAHMGHPVVGDRKYFSTASKVAGKVLHPAGEAPLYLHAWRLGLRHPTTGKLVEVEAPLPAHFVAL